MQEVIVVFGKLTKEKGLGLFWQSIMHTRGRYREGFWVL